MPKSRSGYKYESTYLDAIFDHPARTINRIVAIIRKEFPKCNGVVVGDGISGVSMIAPVALKLKVPFAIARSKSSHSPLKVEGHTDVKRYVFIDDCIDSGKTFRSVYKKMYGWNKSKPIGAVLFYSQDERLRYCTEYKKFRVSGVVVDLKIIRTYGR